MLLPLLFVVVFVVLLIVVCCGGCLLCCLLLFVVVVVCCGYFFAVVVVALYLSAVWYRYCPPNLVWNFGKPADTATGIIYPSYSCRVFNDVP